MHAADSFAPDIGGIERQVEALARHQQEQGHHVTVITAVNDDAELDLDVVRALPGRWLTVAFPWRNYRRIADVLDSAPIDVVHAHFTVISPIAIYVVRAASRRGIPVAITVHSLWWQVAFATRLSTLPFGWGRTRAAWSAVSNVAAGHVRRTLPRAGPVSVVPNLVDVHWWRPSQPCAELGDEIRLILVGRLKKRKHVREFIDVLARARQLVPAGTRVRVTIVGEGPRRADLQRQVNTLRLADWVSFLGHREADEIRTLLHESHLFIASSHQESFGIAALEARAAGLPVLGYLGNGLSDFITHEVDGLLVSDAKEMLTVLARLINEPDELRRLRKTTTTSPPSVGPEQAIAAVEDLYSRALFMHQRMGTK
ncbi:MAG: glycosyltransferase family 4 protein [Jatrophihabitantaceae bacterium]